jgi:ABC-type antimicrobial peptide transport system permease subunit
VRPDAPETRLNIFRPSAQAPSRYLAIAVRASMPPESVVGPVRQAVAAIDPDLPLAGAGSLRVETRRGMSNFNLVITNLGISAGMGLLIAAIGLFGVISQLTIQRTRDIGVRMALGAQSSDVLLMIIGEGMRLLAIGIVLGVPVFLGLNLLLQRTMPEVTLPGFWLLAANVAVLSLTMLLACWLPARRATLINPVEALRAE